MRENSFFIQHSLFNIWQIGCFCKFNLWTIFQWINETTVTIATKWFNAVCSTFIPSGNFLAVHHIVMRNETESKQFECLSVEMWSLTSPLITECVSLTKKVEKKEIRNNVICTTYEWMTHTDDVWRRRKKKTRAIRFHLENTQTRIYWHSLPWR